MLSHPHWTITGRLYPSKFTREPGPDSPPKQIDFRLDVFHDPMNKAVHPRMQCLEAVEGHIVPGHRLPHQNCLILPIQQVNLVLLNQGVFDSEASNSSGAPAKKKHAGKKKTT